MPLHPGERAWTCWDAGRADPPISLLRSSGRRTEQLHWGCYVRGGDACACPRAAYASRAGLGGLWPARQHSGGLATRG